jgi:DNA ligase-1
MATGKSGGGASKSKSRTAGAGPKTDASAGAATAKAATPKAAKPAKRATGEAVPPPVLLAHVWENDVDLSGWWMSEKLDGVRAYWDGRRFVSRLGNEYIAPDWFVAGLPSTPLDGELWVGRKQFQRCVSIVRRQEAHAEWREVRYLIFDAPAHDGAFEERLQHIKDTLARHKPPYAQYHPHEVCRDTEHMRGELRRVEALGGEGLMMRRPRSRYEVGRSHSLLKVKSFHDAEARVIGHQPGTGKHKGRLGALLVEMPNGTQFAVGTGLSDAERSHPPAIGSIITYRYQELSDGGVPRFPSYVGVRHDFAWPGKK